MIWYNIPEKRLLSAVDGKPSEEGVMRMGIAETIALIGLIVNVVYVTYIIAKKK